MLTRGRQRIVALLAVLGAFVRAVAGFSIPEADHEDESETREVANAFHVTAILQAPPPTAPMPIGNRFVHSEPQGYRRYPRQGEDNWWLGTPRVLLDAVTFSTAPQQSL